MSLSEQQPDKMELRAWIGRTRTLHDTIRLQPARFLEATLDRAPSLEEEDALPPLWHWLSFLESTRLSGLGHDGHAAKGEFLPPVRLPRRMWAGGRLIYEHHPVIGEELTRTTIIKDLAVKTGRSGTLCFVVLRHTFENSGGKFLFSEEHDIVYREAPRPDTMPAKTAPPPWKAAFAETIAPSPVLLFRYSALTFNSHRIHYDRSYCEDVEGYPGLIVHGPLTATYLADLASRRNGGKPMKTFSFRATAPLFDAAAFTIAGDGRDRFWAETPDGHLAMEAQATFIA